MSQTSHNSVLQTSQSARSRLVGDRIAAINWIRMFPLEEGIAVREGALPDRQPLPDIGSQLRDMLWPRRVQLIENLTDNEHTLDSQIDGVTSE